VTGRRQWIVVGVIVAAAAAALAVAMLTMGDQLVPIEAGARAPDFHAVEITDSPTGPAKVRTLADYKGQVVLLNIWATWCNPCRAEMPSIERLHAELAPRGLRIVAVSIDNPGMEQPIREFVKELELHFEILYDAAGNIRTDYQTAGAPETFVIGRDGVIRKRVIGAADWNTAAQKTLLLQLLAEPSP